MCRGRSPCLPGLCFPIVAYKLQLIFGRRNRSSAIYREGAAPFTAWLAELKDLRAAGIIRARLNRIRLANFGDCRSVGEGVYELRIDFGPGYRVYFGREGSVVVVLLCAGVKRTQTRDIATAQRYWREYSNAKDSQKRTISWIDLC